MSELVIETHDFDNAKQQLKNFSEKVPDSTYFPLVTQKDGLFKLFNHSVKGEELNDLTVRIQEYLMRLNRLHIASIEEFGLVYKALEALDKDYIQAIISTIKATEKVSEQAKDAAFEAQKNSLDIKKTIEVQAHIIEVLSQFKEQIDKAKLIDKLDKLSTIIQGTETIITIGYDGIQELKNNVESQKKQITELYAQIENNRLSQDKLLNKKLKISYALAYSSIVIALIGAVSVALNKFGVL